MNRKAMNLFVGACAAIIAAGGCGDLHLWCLAFACAVVAVVHLGAIAAVGV